jgi:hypothetical protein
MSSTTFSAGMNREGFDEMVMTRCEPNWLTDLRSGAWKAFEGTPLPDSKAENWRRTDLRLFRFDRYRFAQRGEGHRGRHALPAALLAQGVAACGATLLSRRTGRGVALAREVGVARGCFRVSGSSGGATGIARPALSHRSNRRPQGRQVCRFAFGLLVGRDAAVRSPWRRSR